MILKRKLIANSISGAVLSVACFAPVANADVSASAGVATSYLWRGFDLGQGQGVPAVSADVNYSAGGAYIGTWVSSGDASNGTEFDLYAGYGGQSGMFSYDISVWNYNYPQRAGQEDGFGDLSEVILSLGLGPVSFSWYETVGATPADGVSETYRYFALSASTGPFSATVGHHDSKTSEDEGIGTSVTHLDLSYAYNDNLSFTLSQLLKDQNDANDDDLKVVASYSIPIE